MIDKLNSIIHFFDVGDVRFFFLIGKKNFRNLTILTLLISIFVLIVSMNLEKKYISQATIVISPEENNIVNIEEVYSITNQASRVILVVWHMKSFLAGAHPLELKRGQRFSLDSVEHLLSII